MTRPGTIHRAGILNNRPKGDESAPIFKHPTTGDFPHQNPLGAQFLLQLRDDMDEMLSRPGTKQSPSSFSRAMNGGNDTHRLYT